jgi:O-methyltransferase involved in polyketide biosynthesis
VPERDPSPPPGVDLDRPSVARVYDWYLGGTSNWAIDREFGERVLTAMPIVKPIAMANRLFLNRLVRYLVRAGVRQFVDIGAGIPTMGSTHQVADGLAKDTRVVYADHEPVAVAHSRALLEKYGDPNRHAAINGDLRDPDGLWERVLATGVIDPEQPIALLLIAVLHVQQLDADGVEIGPTVVARYRELLSSGSYLAISHGTTEGLPEQVEAQLNALKRMYDASGSPVIWRSHAEIEAMLGDFELVEPGMTWTSLWHPEETGSDAPSIEFDSPEESVVYVGVGRKR